MPSLQEQFGPIDIYLFDQLLRGRVAPVVAQHTAQQITQHITHHIPQQRMRILDAGCGSGRNLVYLLREGCEIFGADADPEAVEATRQLAAALAPDLPTANFRLESLEAMSFPDAFADVVLSSAVLHFACDDRQFDAMLRGTWRVLKPGGLLFCRLASSIGMEGMAHQARRIAGRRWVLPDGSERYLVDEDLLMQLTDELGGELMDPLKTTVVQNRRCMTTWVVRKNALLEFRPGLKSEP